jgi:hypothetical protein
VQGAKQHGDGAVRPPALSESSDAEEDELALFFRGSLSSPPPGRPHAPPPQTPLPASATPPKSEPACGMHHDNGHEEPVSLPLPLSVCAWMGMQRTHALSHHRLWLIVRDLQAMGVGVFGERAAPSAGVQPSTPSPPPPPPPPQSPAKVSYVVELI